MSPPADRRRVVPGIRYALPSAIVVGGLLLLVIRGAGDLVALEAAAMLVGAGLSVYLLNWLYRVGVAGDVDRDREEAARRFLDEHGHWPGEEPRSSGARRP
jgi:hypothetical protein